MTKPTDYDRGFEEALALVKNAVRSAVVAKGTKAKPKKCGACTKRKNDVERLRREADESHAARIRTLDWAVDLLGEMSKKLGCDNGWVAVANAVDDLLAKTKTT